MVITTTSFSWSSPVASTASSTERICASVSPFMSTRSEWTPAYRVSLRRTLAEGVTAKMGREGRYFETSAAVLPVWVKARMAVASTPSATRQAA